MYKLVALALVVVFVGGCADRSHEALSDSGDDNATASEGAGAATPEPAVAEGDSEAADAGSGALDPGAAVRSVAQLVSTDRAVIRTAELEVRAGDVPEASDRALTLVEAAGGFLANQRSDLEGRARAVLTFKVPPADFLRVLADLAELGDLITRRVGSDDVTGQVVDLEGRLAAVTASVDRLRALLAEAADVPQVVAVEGELARREGELESLTGQLRSLRAQTDLATVTLTLAPPPRRAPDAEPEPSDDIPGFYAGLRTGGAAIVNVASAAATAFGFLLPFLLAAAVLALPGRWAWRRWSRPRRPAVPAAG